MGKNDHLTEQQNPFEIIRIFNEYAIWKRN